MHWQCQCSPVVVWVDSPHSRNCPTNCPTDWSILCDTGEGEELEAWATLTAARSALSETGKLPRLAEHMRGVFGRHDNSGTWLWREPRWHGQKDRRRGVSCDTVGHK